MKKLLCLLLPTLLVFISYAQLPIPINKGQQNILTGTKIPLTSTNQQKFDAKRDALRRSEIKATSSLEGDGNTISFKTLPYDERRRIDTTIKQRLQNIKAAITESTVDSLNEVAPRFQVLASGGVVGTLDDAKTAAGNFSIGVQWRLNQFKQVGRNWIDPLYLCILGNQYSEIGGFQQYLPSTAFS